MDTRTASDTRSGDRLGWVLGLTSTAYFMVVLDSLVVVSALPHMQHDLHASVASLQWTVNSYGISFAAGIITAAAIILAGSLGALMLSSNLLLKQIGFAFSFSILIDALVVRTYLVPAVMSRVGRWNWYNPIPFLNRSKALFERRDE